MYAKLDKLREDLKKAVAKRDAAAAKVKRLEEKLKEEESLQIVSDVTSYHMTPEQLAQFLQLANAGKIQELLRGQAVMPALESELPEDGNPEDMTDEEEGEQDEKI